jgi:hypothetical protein
MRKILNSPICQDDFGNLVYICQYTGGVVSCDNFIFIGAVIPQVSGSYVCSPGAGEAFRLSKKTFDESEANCNTCKNLTRLPHTGRIMRGLCNGEEIAFHPEDYMGKKCWSVRL